MRENTILSVEELGEELELFIWEQGNEICKITEEYTNGKKRTCLTRGLKVEAEDGVVYGSDMDNILLENEYVLSGFVADSVIINQEDKLIFKISFNSGTVVTIEGLAE